MSEEPVDGPPAGAWLSLDDVLNGILASSETVPPRIAFAISGGGASGAYEAGAIEAWLRSCRSLQGNAALRPRFILGSSAGALNATALLVQSLRRPEANPGLGYAVWKSIAPRSAPFVVGPRRTPLVDFATRWVKIPAVALLAALALLFVASLFVVNPAFGSVFALLLALAIAALFRRSVFRNRALKNTVANVLGGVLDAKTGLFDRWELRARANVEESGRAVVESWWEREAGVESANFIVTSTDLSASAPALFTLVDPDVFARLAAHGWQVVQLARSRADLTAYRGSGDRTGWVEARDFVTCVVASTSIPGVFPSQRIELRAIEGDESAEHDFVDGGVLNNSPIDVALDAGATHIISFELEPLRQHGTFRYLAEAEPPSLGRNLLETFETLLSNSTAQGIQAASAWNRELFRRRVRGSDKRLVPIYRFAPRRRELGLMDFNGHYPSAFSRPRPTLDEWLEQGLEDAHRERLFWDATFFPDPL